MHKPRGACWLRPPAGPPVRPVRPVARPRPRDALFANDSAAGRCEIEFRTHRNRRARARRTGDPAIFACAVSHQSDATLRVCVCQRHFKLQFSVCAWHALSSSPKSAWPNIAATTSHCIRLGGRVGPSFSPAPPDDIRIWPSVIRSHQPARKQIDLNAWRAPLSASMRSPLSSSSYAPRTLRSDCACEI